MNKTLISVFVKHFHSIKSLGDRSLAQLTDDDDFRFKLDERTNSIGVIVQHMAGNMRSRWVDFLASDGEKPDRHRDGEFVERNMTRSEVLAEWERGWGYVFEAMAPLTDDDLLRTVTIRNEPHTVIDAIVRQIAHYATHVGQILVIAKHIRGEGWQWLTIPPGGSKQFNEKMGVKS